MQTAQSPRIYHRRAAHQTMGPALPRVLLHRPDHAAADARLVSALRAQPMVLLHAHDTHRADLARLATRMARGGPLMLAAHMIPATAQDGSAGWEAGFLAALRFARAILPVMAPSGRIVFVQDDSAQPLPASSLREFSRHVGSARPMGDIRLSACAASRAATALPEALHAAMAAAEDRRTSTTPLPPALAPLLSVWL